MFTLGGLYVTFPPLLAPLGYTRLTPGSACIASILRPVTVATQPDNEDLTWNIVNQSIWATVEGNLAIIWGMFIKYTSLALIVNWISQHVCQHYDLSGSSSKEIKLVKQRWTSHRYAPLFRTHRKTAPLLMGTFDAEIKSRRRISRPSIHITHVHYQRHLK